MTLRPAFKISPLIERSCEAETREQRAVELDSLGMSVRAKRARSCGEFAWRTCKQRDCVRCAAVVAARNAEQAMITAARFARPVFVTLTLPSDGPFRLSAGLDDYRVALLRWRRSNPVARAVMGGVGGLEPHLDRSQSLWAIHAHLLLDLTAAAELGDLGERWEIATADRGRFLLPSSGADVLSLARAARYATKSADWCPVPGALPLSALGALFRGIRGRRVFIAWGTGRTTTKSGAEK